MLNDKMILKIEELMNENKSEAEIGDMLEKKTGPRRVEVTFEDVRNNNKGKRTGHLHCFVPVSINRVGRVVAVVEYEDGTVEQVDINQMRFTDRDTAE